MKSIVTQMLPLWRVAEFMFYPITCLCLFCLLCFLVKAEHFLR